MVQRRRWFAMFLKSARTCSIESGQNQYMEVPDYLQMVRSFLYTNTQRWLAYYYYYYWVFCLVPTEVLSIVFGMVCSMSQDRHGTLAALTTVSRRFHDIVIGASAPLWTIIRVQPASGTPDLGFLTRVSTFELHLSRSHKLPLNIKIALPPIYFSGLENWNSPLDAREIRKMDLSYGVLDVLLGRRYRLKELHIEFCSGCSHRSSADILCPHQVVDRLLMSGTLQKVATLETFSLTISPAWRNIYGQNLRHSFETCAHTTQTPPVYKWAPAPTTMRIDVWLSSWPLPGYHRLRHLQLSGTIPRHQLSDVLANTPFLETLILRGCYLEGHPHTLPRWSVQWHTCAAFEARLKKIKIFTFYHHSILITLDWTIMISSSGIVGLVILSIIVLAFAGLMVFVMIPFIRRTPSLEAFHMDPL